MKNSIELSEFQKKASTLFGVHVGVSAAAGSGKTAVLVQRYLEAILSQGASCEEILALTFTDKAANVMKMRLRQRLSELTDKTHVQKLDSSWIGTIHSFCARVLKENPIECAVDANFSVLGAGETKLLAHKVMDKLFEEQSSNAEFSQLMMQMGEDAFRQQLIHFYHLQRSYANDARLFYVDDDEESQMSVRAQLKLECEKILSTIKAESASGEKLLNACRELLGCIQHGSNGWALMSQVQSAVDSLDRKSPKIKQLVDDLGALANHWQLCLAQRFFYDSKKLWISIFDQFCVRFDAEKQQKCVLDFEDLIYYLWRALTLSKTQNMALLSRLKKQFKHIFVDEFQDTSYLQDKILSLLKNEANFFIVGDVRQSIYGFRQADPEYFLKALEQSTSIVLADNHRSRRELVDFVNHFFDAHFPQTSPMKAKRLPQIEKNYCVEWISVERGEMNIDEARVIEARTIAARIQEMVHLEFMIEENGHKRPIRYSDIGILMRKSTASRIYEKELKDFSIPYFTNKGRGFYEKKEIMDLVSFIRILENSLDNLSFCSVLRSPLFMLSDDALFLMGKKRLEISRDASTMDAAYRLMQVDVLDKKDLKKLENFFELYEDLKLKKDRAKISELLTQIIQETSYDCKILSSEDGVNAQGNIWKLLDVVSEIENRSFGGLSDFIQFLRYLQDMDETEEEVKLVGEEEDSVKLLTVHSSKGLEFPCVILADLGGSAKPKGKEKAQASLTAGLGMILKNPIDGYSYEDFSYQQISSEQKLKESAEEMRLLYVAMTRAKDHLIFSGVDTSTKTQSEAPNWFELLRPVLTKMSEGVYHVPVHAQKAPSKKAVKTWKDHIPQTPDDEIVNRELKKLQPRQKAYELLEDFTVSEIMEFANDATGEVTYQLPSFNDVLSDEDESNVEVRLPRNEFGTAFHKMMELSIDLGQRGILSDKFLEEFFSSLAQDEKQELQKSFGNFWDGPLGAEVLSAKKCFAELPFVLKTRRGVLKGQIDLVYQSSTGWVILDYKTNRLEDPGDEAKAVGRYRWQMGLYALAFWRLYGEVPAKCCLYFSRPNKSVDLIWTAEELEHIAHDLESFFERLVLSKSS